MGCGTSMIKYFLFLFNFLTAILGIGLIVLGSLLIVAAKKGLGGDIHIEDPELEEISSSSILTIAGAFSIVIGIIAFLTSFCGCCGAIRESKCLVLTYSIVMVLLFILEVVIIICLFVMSKTFAEEQVGVFNGSWDSRHDPNHMKVINAFQRKNECCGNDGAADFRSPLDASCCPVGEPACILDKAYKIGCKKAIFDGSVGESHLMAYIAMGIAIFELVAAIFGFVLVNHIRNEDRRSRY